MGSRVNGGLVVASGNVLYTRKVVLGQVAHNKIVLLKVPDKIYIFLQLQILSILPSEEDVFFELYREEYID